MGKTLQLRGCEADAMSQAKSDAQQPMLGRSLAVVRTLLPSGEGLPLLVDRDNWLPASLAMRWVVPAALRVRGVHFTGQLE